LAGGPDPFDGQVEREQWVGRVTSGVLDRQTGDTRVHGGRHMGLYVGRIDRETTFEVRVHRYRDGVDDHAEMLQRCLEGDLVIREAEGPGESRTRGGQRLEAHLFQGLRAARVPRVRHHETAGGVQTTKRRPPIIACIHAVPH
jgi:hypothetical protein